MSFRVRGLPLLVAFLLTVVPCACHVPPPAPPSPNLPDVAAPEDAPTLRPSPTPPGRQGDVSGPPVVKP